MSENTLLNSVFANAASIPAEYDLKRFDQKEYLCGGKILTWNGSSQEVLSPVCRMNGAVPERIAIGSFPLLSTEEAMKLLDTAYAAFAQGRGEWPTASVEKRIECVTKFVGIMKTKRSDVVKFLMWEIGKTLSDAEKEFDRTVQYIEDTIDALKDLDRASSRLVIEEGIIGQIRRSPMGVVLCMGPFNYPLNETFTTLIPALIMGNTVVLKPAKHGVLLLHPLLDAFMQSFPAGVVNILYGKGRDIVGALMESGKVDVLAFIGSYDVANKLVKAHPRPNRLRSVLGLNAKNPAIVLADADIDTAVSEVVLGSLSFNGQRCTAIKIVFVHKTIADEFLKKMSEAVKALSFGLPWEKGVKLTPLPEIDKTQTMKAYVDDALANGAKVINENGGTMFGTMFYPAVVYPVTSAMKLYNEEQFGPVIPVVPFDSADIPVSYIEQSNFGQQVSIFGKEPTTIAKMIDHLVNQVSRVNINCQCQRGPDQFPFTGRKDSAEGTLSVSDALRVFSIRALVAAKENDGNKMIVNSILRERTSNFLSTDFII
jgi:glyceraldehyde-3-phosphate dehydrogenase (NADP+)